MAQDLAIAKAALSASLFRADPTSLSRPAVEAFFPLLSSTLTQCSRPNVQKCKAWIVDNIAPSPARTAALAKFLASLSNSFHDTDGEKPSARRRRLHILYVVHDVVHHVVVKLGNKKFGDAWETHLPTLVASAAAFDNCPKHQKKLRDLVQLWEDEKGYFSPALIARIRTALTDGSATVQPPTGVQAPMPSVKLSKDSPFVLPSFHGDPSTPWYDLPATTWLPHMIPNSAKPLRPDDIRPIQLAPGSAEKQLVAAVQGLLADVELLFSKERKLEDEPQTDLNELGETIILDEVTGEPIGGQTYYGWSRTFCEKMKGRRNKAKNGQDRGRSRSRSSSYSRGRSRSSSGPPAFKRRRASSGSRSPRRHSRSRSYSQSMRRVSGSRSRSRSRSRSPDQRSSRPFRRRSHTRSPSRSRSRSRPSYRNRSPPHQLSHQPPPPFPPAPPAGDLPPPPPPPAGYQGAWPPPPPPPPPMGGSAPSHNWFPNPGMIPPTMMGRGGWGNAPPPPPPHHSQGPHHQQGHHFGGRGGGGFRGRGRGGYDRGRGW